MFTPRAPRVSQLKTNGSDGLFPRIVRAVFKPFPDKPDHPALELEVLELWEREGTFDQLRRQNAGGPNWSFIDGPITANGSLARAPRRGDGR